MEKRAKTIVNEDLNQVMRHRREKLETLRKMGIEPYAYVYDRSHLACDAMALFDQNEARESLDEKDIHVSVAGRLLSYRSHGKSAFGHIEDRSGQIQIYLKKDILPWSHLSFD